MKNNSRDVNLIKIEPVEYQFKMGPYRNPRILRYRNRVICLQIEFEDLKEKIAGINNRKPIEVKMYSPKLVSYQYKGKPEIILNIETFDTFVTSETLEKYGERDCQQQSSIIFRLMKDFLYVHFIRKSNTLNPDKIGKTAKDRDITYRAFKYLMHDPID